MKVKFTKLAALLLAGAALLASGCTDYEVDIQKANQRIDQLAQEKASVAELNNQVAGLNATINQLKSDLSGDIKKVSDDLAALTTLHNNLRTDFDNAVKTLTQNVTDLQAADAKFVQQIKDLNDKYNQLDADKADKAQVKIDIETAVAGEKARAEAKEKELETAIKTINEVTIPAIEDQIKNINEVVIPDLKNQIKALQDGKVDKVDFEKYKEATAQTIQVMKDAIGDLTKLNTEKKSSLVEAINEVVAKFDDYVLTTTFQAFVDIAATDEELAQTKAALDGRIDALEAFVGEYPEEYKTVKEYIDAKLLEAKNERTRLEGLINGLDARVGELEKTMTETVLPQIKFALDYESEYAWLFDVEGGLQAYIMDQAIEKYLWAAQDLEDYNEWLIGELNEIFDDIYGYLSMLLSRVQSIVYVPDYDDQKMTMNLVYYSDYAGNFAVIGKETEVQYKVNPADAFDNEAALKKFVEEGNLKFDVVPVKTRAEGEVDAMKQPQLDIVGVKAGSYDPTTGKFTLIVRPNNIVSSAFADYQIDPSAMYFALLSAQEKGSEMELVQDEDGNYVLVNIPFGPDFSTHTDSETVIEWLTSTVSVPAGYHWEIRDRRWVLVQDFADVEVSYWAPVTYVWYAYNAEQLEEYKAAIEAVQAAIDEYNEKVSEEVVDENERIEKYNELVAAYNDAVDAYNNALASYINALQRRGGSKNFAAALNIYIDDQATDISSTYTTLYPSKYEESEHIVIEKDPYKKLEEPTEKGDVVAYTDWLQELEFNSKETKEILTGAIPAITITTPAGDSRTISYDLAREEGYLVVEPTWSNAVITYFPIFGEEKYFVVENEFEDKLPPYATVEMNYLDENHPNGGYNNATLKGRVNDYVFGTYALKDNMFGNNWSWLGGVKVVPPTANIDLSLEKPITWTYANDADVDHNRFYRTDGNKEYFRENQAIKIDTDLDEIAEKFGITANELQYFRPTNESREVTMYEVEVVNAKGKTESYEVRVSYTGFGNSSRVYTAYKDGKVAENVSPLKLAGINLDPKTNKLDLDITNFEWDKTYTVTAKYYYSENPYLMPPFNKVSVIAAVKFVFNTVDRSRADVTLPTTNVTFAINGADFQANDGGWYKWVGKNQQEAYKNAFVAGGVVTADDFESVADFADQELKNNIVDVVTNADDDLFGYVDIDKVDQIARTTKQFTSKALHKFAKRNNKNVVQDPDDPYKFLGATAYRYVTTYIGEKVIIPFTFSWTVPAYDYIKLDNQTFQEEGTGIWFSYAAPKYVDDRDVLTRYDVSYMNVPALAFNIVDAKGNIFNYKDELNETPYFYDKNLVASFYFTDPKFGAKELEPQCKTNALQTFENLWTTDQDPAKKGHYEHSVFYYRSTLDAIPMFGKLEIVSGDDRFEIPTSFGDPYTGVKLAETPYSNYELRAWKPFVVDSYKQSFNLDLKNPGVYEVDLLKGIQFSDARQVPASTPESDVIKVVNGVKCYVRPMMQPNGGWVIGNGTKANGYALNATSASAYEIVVDDFDWDSVSTVPAQYRAFINVVEDPETWTYKMQFDYTSEIEFKGTAAIPFTFQLATKWQKLEEFEVTVVIRGMDAQ